MSFMKKKYSLWKKTVRKIHSAALEKTHKQISYTHLQA